MPPLSGFRKVYFNAPAMTRIDIVKYPGRYQERQAPDGVAPNVGYEFEDTKRSLVMSRKGWLTPDLTFSNDWTTKDPEDSTDDGERATTNQLADEQEVSLESLFPANNQYGFRFMYNPPEISFSLGISTGVNAQYVMMGLDKATPMVPTGSTINLDLTISRVDDLAVIYGANGNQPLSDGALRNLIDEYGAWSDRRSPHAAIINSRISPQQQTANNLGYKVDVETKAVMSQIREIAKLGTMHDLNYLFRTFVARDFDTAYRGITSDIGIGFSVPMILCLGNDNFTYRVRLGAMNYTHTSFNPDMIPMVTNVALSFERIPDAIAWTGSPQTTSTLTNRN